MSTNPISHPITLERDFVRLVSNLCNGGQFDLTDSPLSFMDNVKRFVADYDAAATEPGAQTVANQLRDLSRAPDLSASLAKLTTWAETYARQSGIDVATSTGPLASDIEEARALIARNSPAADQAAHTPTPYYLHGIDNPRDGREVIMGPHGEVCRVPYMGGYAEQQATAAFIVRACNNHAALANALRAMVSRYDDNSPEADNARAVLAAANS